MRVWYMVVVLAFATVVSSTKYTTYYMDKTSRTISLTEITPAIAVKGSESQSYRPVNKYTWIWVTAPPGYNMVVSVVYFNLPKIDGKCGDKIEFKGLAEPSDDVEMCGGQSEIAKVFYTPEGKGNQMKITFETIKRREDFNERANFEFVITAVRKTKKCDSSLSFECANKYCVPRDYTCDTFNNCGDNSDEKLPHCTDKLKDSYTEPGLSLFNVIIIICCSFIGLALLASIIIYKCRKRPSRNAGELSRISTVEGQLHRSPSYNSTPNPNDPVRRPASTSPVNPPYNPYYQNDAYQPYQGSSAPEQDIDSAPPPYEEVVSSKS